MPIPHRSDDHLPHRHGPHHRGPHAHRWHLNLEEKLRLEQVGALYLETSRALGADDAVEFDGFAVRVPDSVEAVLRHETAPGGEFVLKLDLRWADGPYGVPEHPPRRPHADGWLFNFEGSVSRPQAAELLASLGAQLAAGGPVNVGEHIVVVPSPVHSVVRYERAPKGELVFKHELVWTDGHGFTGRPISDLLT